MDGSFPPNFKGIDKNAEMKVTKNEEAFLELLQLAIEEEAEFEFEDPSQKKELISIKVGHLDA